ncbi:hypothetical protein V6N12_024480 [Hibiscus sabdariffa]|uniref:Uncharacterized protein n=1 Tax=Hibiscus sabdariffa TaxID=183260 RepID=A0ABR2G174_9ROSI
MGLGRLSPVHGVQFWTLFGGLLWPGLQPAEPPRRALDRAYHYWPNSQPCLAIQRTRANPCLLGFPLNPRDDDDRSIGRQRRLDDNDKGITAGKATVNKNLHNLRLTQTPLNMKMKQRAVVQDLNREPKSSKRWISRMVTEIKKPMAWVETRGHMEPNSSGGAHHERREGGNEKIKLKTVSQSQLATGCGFQTANGGG